MFSAASQRVPHVLVDVVMAKTFPGMLLLLIFSLLKIHMPNFEKTEYFILALSVSTFFLRFRFLMQPCETASGGPRACYFKRYLP